MSKLFRTKEVLKATIPTNGTINIDYPLPQEAKRVALLIYVSSGRPAVSIYESSTRLPVIRDMNFVKESIIDGIVYTKPKFQTFQTIGGDSRLYGTVRSSGSSTIAIYLAEEIE